MIFEDWIFFCFINNTSLMPVSKVVGVLINI